MEIGLVRKVDIDHEMQQSYLDYAMSVIVARALPDARDGLKPVQRRILYAMYDMGLRADSSYKKSARIVGEVLGKYHPHGDVAVYEAMARLAQLFSMRYPLVDGQGNFGSVDGDPPAAMRYTEARLTPFALDILNQIDRNTINFTRNFDDTLDEPEVLPAALPNLLVNGASGIAVGMATNIPPHNLGEVIDAISYLLQNWDKMDDISVAELTKFILGPDLPTGGIILQDGDRNDLLSAYGTGRGRVIVRGRVHFEDMGRGRSRIIITELPYQTNKSALIERIAELVREGALDGISDLRDESDRQGMRIVIELNKADKGENILRELYKRTPLESTLSISLLALVNGEPRLLTLKQALKVYVEHRLEVVKRRSEYDLLKAKQRAHILEGLRIAINNLDEVIATIRNAPDVETARTRLMKRFKLSEAQTQAILEMQLRRLAALERKKIELEYKDLVVTIKELEALLKSPKKMREVVQTELLAMRQLYGDRRRTQIVSLREGEVKTDFLTATDMTPAQTVWVGITPDGLIGRTQGEDLPRISGRQAAGWLIRTNTHHTLYFAAKNGRGASFAVHTLPEVESFADGVPLAKVSPFKDDDELVSIFTLPPISEISIPCFVMTVTRSGMLKKSEVTEMPGPSSQAFQLVKINPEDQLCKVLLTDGQSELILVSAQGMIIRFSEQDIRPMGLVAAGVNGMKLAQGDEVVGAERVSEGEILIAASNGLGWRFNLDAIPLQGRYGQGVIATKLSAGVSIVGTLFGKLNQTGIVHFKYAASKIIRVDQIDNLRRGAKGQEITPIKAGEVILAITPVTDNLSMWQQSGKQDKSPAGKRTKKANATAATKGAPTSAKPLEKPSPVKKTAGTTKKQGAASKATQIPKIGRSKPGTETAKTTSKSKTNQATRTKKKPEPAVSQGKTGDTKESRIKRDKKKPSGDETDGQLKLIP